MTERSSGNMVGDVPMVSVIVPTRNRPQFLKEAVKSILEQTFGSFEIIVVNDAGEDVSEIINSFKDERIKYIRHDANKGLAASRNTGVKAAGGKYIAYLDDDDIYYPDHLEILAGFLENSGCAVAYSDSYQALQVRDNGRYITKEKRLVYSEDFDRQRLLVMNYIPFINIVHRRECIEQAGFFDETLKSHEDWDCLIRLSQSYDFHHVKKVTAEFRTRHTLTDSLSSDRSEMLKTMKLIHSRYSPLASGPNIIRQQKYVENVLAKEITHKKRQAVNPESLSVVTTKKGVPSLRVKGDDSILKTLHSLYDPEEEARALVDAFQFDGKGILVVLGLGLGYHVAELVKKYPEAVIVVVEAMPEIFELAKEHGPEIKGNVKYIVGILSEESKNPPLSPFSKGGINSSISRGGGEGGFEKAFSQYVLKEITQHQMKDGIKPLSVFTLSSAVSAFPQYYRPVLDALKKTTAVRLWERLRYPKFRESSLKVLLLDSGYFLVSEIEKALTSSDHEVMKISTPVPNKLGQERPSDNEAIIPKLIGKILEYRPDFILTMNHLGFDEEGALTSFLRSIEMPVASWYVDSPNLILRAFDSNVSQYVSLFIWDRTYMNDMKAMGFEAVEYLPLGTDANVFKPMNKIIPPVPPLQKGGGLDVPLWKRGIKGDFQNRKIDKYSCDVGFVGNSMIEPVEERMSKIDRKYHVLIEKIAMKLACPGIPYISAIEELRDSDKRRYGELNSQEKTVFEAAVLWKATLLYRLECIKMLGEFDLHIHGDCGWNSLLDQKNIKILPPLNYYRELPLLYNACKINFNATSRQMKEAVNQRVFDVPACGAFLLTDYQKSLDELFEVGREIIVYKERGEIPGLVKYYLDNPGKREAVAGKGMERVVKEHTYKHRLDVMINAMKARYA
jgi:spore maturation protein CgeB